MTPKPKIRPKKDEGRFSWPDKPTLRFIIQHALRPRKELCEIQGCPDALEIRDDQDFLIRRENCDSCPLIKLNEAIAQSVVLHRCFDLDFALTAGVTITLDEIDVEEFRALKILRNERTKYENELNRQASSGR